jgi:hypothetical protein
MRLILNVTIPVEPFNSMVRKGTAGATIKKVLEAVKPEACYFTEQNGDRGAVLVVDLKDSSQIPALCEPWYLSFNATCKFTIAMTPEDLGRANLEQFGKGW